MLEQLTSLRKLQEYDLDIETIQGRTTALREQLDELVAMHEALNGSLEGQRKQLDETRSLMRDKEIELEANLDRYNQSKGKLNAVTNTREYKALETEMDTLRKMRAQLEEERDSLAEAVEGYEADVADKADKTKALEKQIKKEEDGIRDEADKAQGDVDKLESKRTKIKKDLPKALVRRYEFISGRRPGAAVVPAVGGVCTGCNMMLPPQLYNELHVGDKIIQCPNCQRILFYEAPEEADADAS